MGGSGDHAIHVAQMDHHRGEIGAVEQALTGRFNRDTPVGAQPGVFGGEPLQQIAAGRIGDGDAVQVDAMGRSQFANLVGIAQDD